MTKTIADAIRGFTNEEKLQFFRPGGPAVKLEVAAEIDDALIQGVGGHPLACMCCVEPQTPLDMACKQGKVEVVKLLVASDKTRIARGLPLHFAAYCSGPAGETCAPVEQVVALLEALQAEPRHL